MDMEKLAVGDIRFLYHGTSERHLNAILREGLVPRGERENDDGNWHRTVESNPDAVYLTTSYAGYFAMNAIESEDDRWLLLEIAMNRLDESRLRPDEDFLEQCSRGAAEEDAEVIGSTSMEDRTRFYREQVHSYAAWWGDSLESLGTVGYYGTVKPHMITRLALFDPKQNPQWAWSWADPSITPLNYLICGSRYRAMTRWMFGEDVTVEDVDPFLAAVPDARLDRVSEAWKATLGNRSGVEVREMSACLR